MTSTSPLGGLIPVLSTPMNADETLDEGGIERLMDHVVAGATGHTANPVMMFPKMARQLYNHVRAGRLAEARDVQRAILHFLRRLPKLGNREMSAETKAVLEIRGIAQRHVSAPFRSATDAEVAEIARLIDELQIR